MTRRFAMITTCLVVLGSVSGTAAFAGQFTLTWDASVGASGYKLHYGTQPGQLTTTDDVGNVTQTTVSGLNDCEKWYFAVSAYNAAGDSGNSNIVNSFLVRETEIVLPNTQRTAAVTTQGEQLVLSLTGSAFDSGAVISITHPDWACPRPDCLASERSQSHLDNLPPEVRNTLQITDVVAVSCTEIQALVTVGPAVRGERPAEEGGYVLAVTRGDGDLFEFDAALVVDLDRSRFNVGDQISSGKVDGEDFAHVKRLQGQCDRVRYPTYCPAGSEYLPVVDITGNGMIGGAELSYVMAQGVWGGCWNPTTGDWSLSACPAEYRSTADPDALQ